jgi:hypothetical protein
VPASADAPARLHQAPIPRFRKIFSRKQVPAQAGATIEAAIVDDMIHGEAANG